MRRTNRPSDSKIESIAAILTLTFLIALALPAAQATSGPPTGPLTLTHGDRLAPVLALPRVDLPRVDRIAAVLEDMERERAGLAPRFAIPNDVLLSPETDGAWEKVGNDTRVWRLRIASPGAESLNLGFKRYFMPEGGALFVYDVDFNQVLRAFTAADNADHGELWTPVLLADELVVEVILPKEARNDLILELNAVNVGYRGFGKAGPDKAGSCNVDVVCPEGNPWRDEIPSVGVISTGGYLFCTGVMVNNTAEDQTPYFMTSEHCGIKASNAASLVVYWNFESPSCGQQGGGSLSRWQTGSYWRAGYSASDFTLVELDEAPDPAWDITFAGWYRGATPPAQSVAIHHPNCDEKSISFENDPAMVTSYLGYISPGDGTHIRVIDWDLGTTESGSSGSPLFNESHQMVGQLGGGYAACNNDLSDWYGRFAVSWYGGGSSSRRLLDWLDPGGTGALSVDTLVPGAEFCGNGNCGAGEDPCTCPDDCGAPPATEGTCDDGVDDDCDGLTDCDDGDCGGHPACICDGDGTCDVREDCDNCPADCIGGAGAVCGNGVCEAGDGEDCLSCPADCNGKQGGKPSKRYCCGDGDGVNPVGCGDPRCSAEGLVCSDVPAAPYCCGDAVCEGPEDGFSCEIDCGPPPFCGDGTCDPTEAECTCPGDCGMPPSTETQCGDGVDEDCDGFTDCDDADCEVDPICSCLPRASACTLGSECCSGRCHRGFCK